MTDPEVYQDSRDWVLTTQGVKSYPKAANQLIELAESRGWWALDGLPVRAAPDGLLRIRVEIGRGPVAGRNGYRYMVLWTMEPGPHSQFSVTKIMAMSTEWDGWVQVPGTSDIMAKMNRFPLQAGRSRSHSVTAAPALRDFPGAGAGHCFGRA